MFKNYFKTAWRNMVRHKGHSFINIFGLAMGLTVCLLISMYVAYELSYDGFHANKERIFRVPVIWGSQQSRMQFAGALPALAEAAQKEIPEVKLAGRVRADRDAVLTRRNNDFREENFFFADPAILKIFSFFFLEGDPRSALTEPFSMVISERQAIKYFGSRHALGQTVQYDNRMLRVSGIFKSFPAQTHLPFDFVVSYGTLAALGRKTDAPWGQWGTDLTYLLLKKSTSAKSVAAKLQQLLKRNVGGPLASQMELVMQPLAAIHWDDASRGDSGPKGNRLYVYLFSTTALLIILVVCFNFVNLTMARYLTRLREVGVRKALGASRRQLVSQFLAESMMVAGVALAVCVILFLLFYPALYRFLGAQVVFSAPHVIFMGLVLAAIFVLVGVLTPLYPALFLSRFRPADAVKNFNPEQKRRFSFRQPLIVLQFAISIALIFGVLVLFKQLQYVRHADLGFDRENVAMVVLPGSDPDNARKYGVFRDELLKNSLITGVSGAFTVPGVNSRFQMSINKKNGPLPDPLSIQTLPVDWGFVKTLGLKIVAGRDFSPDRALDVRQGVILNETAVSTLGLKDPIGEVLLVPDDNRLREAAVVGVVKDFHIQSLHQKIEPCLLLIQPDSYIRAVIKMKPGTEDGSLFAIRQIWKRVFGEAEFSAKFLESSYENLYQTEETSAMLLVFFMSMVLLFSCIGLLGMASFLIGRQSKEIGVRKICGASTGGIVRLLSFRLVKWIWGSCLIAWPLAYFFCEKWLADFAYRTHMGPEIFLVSGGAALLMALGTVSGLTLRAACANPVDSLRYE